MTWFRRRTPDRRLESRFRIERDPSQPYDLGWKAWINDVEVPMLRGFTLKVGVGMAPELELECYALDLDTKATFEAAGATIVERPPSPAMTLTEP